VKISLGGLKIEDNTIQDYIEKPTYHFSVRMGMYVMNRGVIEHRPQNAYFDLPTLIRN
jgi:hypothetical protein